MKSVLLEMEKLRKLNSGLGQFCLHLGKALAAANPPDLELNFYVPAAQRKVFGDRFRYVTHSSLHKILPASPRMDVWHCMHQGSKYMPSSRNTKVVLTIQDLNFLQKYSGLKRMVHLHALQQRVKRAAAIAYASKFTEQEARGNLELPAVPSKVIHAGNSLESFPHAARPRLAPHGNFIFAIGIISEKKNFHTLVRLLAELKNVSLVIAGNNTGAYAKQIVELGRSLRVSDRLVLPGMVSDEEKYWLYAHCEAFVFPSLAEGFGLPVVEAMSCGKPVFLASSSSLPEIGGDAAYYWDRFDAAAMKTVFDEGMADFSANPSRAQKCIARAEGFSWKKTAEEYLGLYRSV